MAIVSLQAVSPKKERSTYNLSLQPDNDDWGDRVSDDEGVEIDNNYNNWITPHPVSTNNYDNMDNDENPEEQLPYRTTNVWGLLNNGVDSDSDSDEHEEWPEERDDEYEERDGEYEERIKCMIDGIDSDNS